MFLCILINYFWFQQSQSHHQGAWVHSNKTSSDFESSCALIWALVSNGKQPKECVCVSFVGPGYTRQRQIEM